MLAPIPDAETFLTTRAAWHTLAERVLAPARYAASGRIGLQPAPGGFGTPPFGAGRSLAVDGTDLVDISGAVTNRHLITTLRVAATVAGVAPDAETGVYTPTTPNDPDSTLTVDPVSAARLGEWFAFGQRMLNEWAQVHSDGAPSEIQLWPEHFDLALDLGPDAARANYGASPGDPGHALPYLYVGPWNPKDDPFWNAGTYARLGYNELASAPDPASRGLEFFARGFAVATGASGSR